MKRAVVVLCLFVATLAYAETLPRDLQKRICKPGTETKTSTQTFAASAGKGDIAKFTGTTNFCANERVTLEVSPEGNRLTDRATCICVTKEQMDAVGCEKGKTQPTVTTVIDRKISRCATDSVTISKCVADPEAAYEAACKSGLSYARVDPSGDINIPLDPDITKAPAPVITDASPIAQALVAAGVEPAKAKEIATKDAISAAEYINAVASGDTEAIKATAAKLEINPNLSADVAQIEAIKAAVQQPATDPAAAVRDTYRADTTFPASAPQTPNGQEILPTNGKRLTVYVPHDAPGCETSIQGCIATSRPNLFGQSVPMTLDCVRKGECQFVSLASDPSNYGKFFNVGTVTYTSAEDGKTYTLENVAGYVHDTGGAFRGRPDKLDIAATICSGCTEKQAASFGLGRAVGATGTYGSYAESRPSSPLAFFTGQQAPFVGNTYGSPFANVNPVAPSQYVQQASYVQPAAYQQPATYRQPASYPQPLPVPQQPVPVSVVPVYTPAKPTASLVVQPKSVASGESVSVAWSSAGTSRSSPCVLSREGEELATGNEGSRRFVIRSSTVFRLACTGVNGESVTRASEVILK